jgi:nucleoside-diphosphate-sugar epimerase
MKILVTGGTGFVGRQVVQDLLAQGHEVRLLARQIVLREGIETYHLSDIEDEDSQRLAMQGVDAVCHLAGRAHVMGPTPADHEALFEKVNVDWTRRLAGLAFESGVRRFVFVSSIGAVGSSSEPGRPLTEQTLCQPTTPYGLSKLKAEEALREMATQHGGEWVIVRPPLVHGKGAPGNLARLGKLVRTGLPLPLGGLRNARSLIHVSNLSAALSACLQHPQAAGQVFHVRDNRDYSTPDILRGVARSLGRPARLFKFPTPLLRLGARLAGQEAAFEQLAGWLQVDDAVIRTLLDFQPRTRPFEI